jgi:hypothetical protein
MFCEHYVDAMKMMDHFDASCDAVHTYNSGCAVLKSQAEPANDVHVGDAVLQHSGMGRYQMHGQSPGFWDVLGFAHVHLLWTSAGTLVTYELWHSNIFYCV